MLLFYGTLCKGDHVADQGERFHVKFSSSGVSSLKVAGDVTDLNFIKTGSSLGDVVIKYRTDSGKWAEYSTSEPSDKRAVGPSGRSSPIHTVSYSIGAGKRTDLRLVETFELKRDELVWQLHFSNLSNEPLEIGDIALPEVVNTRGSTYATRLNMHRMIAGHGSFIYWVRADGRGNRLVMTPYGRYEFGVF